MTASHRLRRLLVVLACLAASTAQADPGLAAMSDAPDPGFRRPQGTAGPDTYAQALSSWTTAESVNAWIGARFSYDPARALALSETARAAPTRIAIHEPERFFLEPRGICVDLARFAVATLRRVEPTVRTEYLMVEFAPVIVSGQVLRRHWLATFQRDGKHYFFADSKRPGHMAGPYDSVAAFIAEYGSYRGRPIVAHRVLPTWERRLREQAPRAAGAGRG